MILQDKITQQIRAILEPSGFDLVHLEFVIGQQKILRAFIEKPESVAAGLGAGITLDDCAQVNHLLSEPLDAMPDLEALFKGTYELEVSSPGVDRPLRQVKDFQRFKGREAKIQVLRPLTGEELGSEDYQKKNPKQKKFVGIIDGVEANKIEILISPEGSFQKNKSGQWVLDRAMRLTIPFDLVTKANLEPRFEFE